jgi:signal transduction histidine kinase
MALPPLMRVAEVGGRKAGPVTLGRLLALVMGSLALAVMLGIWWMSAGLLRDQAEEQALSRVRVAGLAARDRIRRESEDALNAARLLATRPTLSRLVADARPEPLAPFLQRFCSTSGLDSCAVLSGDRAIAVSGKPLPWATLLATSEEQGERLLMSDPAAPEGLLGSVIGVPGLPDVRVAVARLFDDRFESEIRTETGEDVRLLQLTNWIDTVDPAMRELHSAALTDDRFNARRIERLDVYAASVPVLAATGEGVALIEVRLPAAVVEVSVARFLRRLAVFAIVVGALAVLAGVVLGRRVARPLRAITRSAVRLGQGDFSPSIPVEGSRETRALARTLENMRRNLVELTTELRQREAEAQAVLKGVVEGVFAVDSTRTIRYANPQAARMLGVELEDMVGRFCGDVLHPIGPDGVRPCDTDCPILRAREGGSGRATEVLERPDGTHRTVVITSAEAADGMQVQVMRDETEVEAVRRARDHVLANIAHEFRTPLAAQLASIELLQDGLAQMSHEELRTLVGSLQRGALRLTRLIDNLLESVRIESGQLSIRRQPVALAQVVHDAAEMLAGLFTQRRQALEVDLPEDLPVVEGDAPRLTQVFVNLLANANKFGPEDSRIRIGGEAEGTEVRIWVEDEGPGAPGLEQSSIFNRFYRSADQEPEPRGLGLGLWIVRSIVERHGGTVAAGRTPEDRTRFTIVLPAGKDET